MLFSMIAMSDAPLDVLMWNVPRIVHYTYYAYHVISPIIEQETQSGIDKPIIATQT